MKSKKRKKETQEYEVLSHYLSVKNISADSKDSKLDSKKKQNNRIQIFFNLIYLKPPLNFILESNPFENIKSWIASQNSTDSIESNTQDTKDSKDLQKNKKIKTESEILQESYEALAIILTCNPQNIDTFIKLKTFVKLCEIFYPQAKELSCSHLLILTQCLQASLLYYLDSKSIKPILKHIKTLRESGIITFHDEKCIEASLNAESSQNKAKENTQNLESSDISFINFNTNKTLLKTQLDSIQKAKKILKSTSWASNLVFLSEGELVKTICVVGRKKSGKSTLLATILHDNKKDSKSNERLESIAPICYMHGKDYALAKYLEFSDLKSLQESPLPKVSQMITQLHDNYHNDLKQGEQRVEINKIQEAFYKSDKVQIIEHIDIFSHLNMFKYVNFINTPSLIPLTFRHLQIYHYVIKSNIIFYMINADIFLQNAQAQIDKEAISLARMINKEHIEFVYVIYTQVDKVALTLKRRQNIYLKFKNAIESRLDSNVKKDVLLKKISFHYVASNVAYKIRNGINLQGESGLDIATSGIPTLEKTLFNNIFERPINTFNIKILRSILRLMAKNYSSKDFSKIDSKDVGVELESLKKHLQEALKKLPTKYSSFYSSFTNLRDNLYSQFIQSLNYEIRNKSAFNVRRLKTSTMESLIVGLQGLAEILQENFFNLPDFQVISDILNVKSSNSFMRFAATKEHKEILESLQSEFSHITKQNLFDDSNVIVTEHLSNMLDSILPNSIKKQDIKEDSVIMPIRDSFEYYFLLLERNISMLFNTRIALFEKYITMISHILESVFINYYTANDKTDTETLKGILNELELVN
ncbi:hypothetical protein DCO58_05420 [Helicobacter saguini]|uniref:Uncharacterized protein n=1 Tax=Helicobacter saguini TaxID=1548018 RepID=A0A347VT75_9HELI|nr:hypothetical protein [Helicobacter saguini]MWV62211.1 hypothetical protein [Helicobacter saguini]MWV67116.1 hypothetical protein [Helicobacter saguini]MWV69466.1 hypothetical protein [Helicobacter saguini]MWV70981.1 hypothetical protein [Helicobacter saguini]TLD92935.1 hypothetical protein LS64_009600 [Helicobacter saguini]